jgi:metal-responsive CopG/Arc/MetJ family transcriptional regulator
MAISITLPRTLIDEMELELNPEESRSAFIAEAIKAYIEVK